MSTETVFLLGAEIVLVAAAVLIYIAGAFVEARRVWSWVALGGIVLAALALATWGAITTPGGSVTTDKLAYYVRWLALAAGALIAMLAWRPLAKSGTPEYIGSLLLTIVGVMMVAGAEDLMLLFVGLELVSIPTYIVLYLGRRDAASQEAAAKYFFLSVLASAMLLYGFSFLYGATGSTDLGAIYEALTGAGSRAGGFPALANVALVLVFAGLGFKIAAVPFHFYAPDVYQGTSHANAGLLSVVPKIAGMVALIRVVALSMPEEESYAWPIAMALAILTMTLGNMVALWQENIRRLLAYSSIAHAGYMLIGLSVYLASAPEAAVKWDGVGALLLYLVVYAVATIGTFAALACLGRGEKQIDDVEELAGLAWTAGPTRPLLALAIALFMFSLTGIPPLAGFWGKLAVFFSALGVGGNQRGWFVGLAVAGVLNAAIAAAYYLRIVGVMFFRMPLGTPPIQRGAGGAFAATVLCAVLVLAIGLSPGTLIRQANHASPSRSASVTQSGRSSRSARTQGVTPHGGGIQSRNSNPGPSITPGWRRRVGLRWWLHVRQQSKSPVPMRVALRDGPPGSFSEPSSVPLVYGVTGDCHVPSAGGVTGACHPATELFDRPQWQKSPDLDGSKTNHSG